MPHPTDPSPELLSAMQAWRTAHPGATLAEIEREASRQVASLRRDLIAAVLAPEAEADPVCPTCGGPMRRNGTRTRTVVTDQDVPLPVTVIRYRCSVCGTELSPPQ